MSRRKQTKPFKVEDKLDLRSDKKRSLRKILSKTVESVQRSSPQNNTNSENLTDGYATADSDPGKRSKRGNKCNECGKVLASSLSLVRHKLTHSANKPFECPKCGAGFKTSSNMHRHLRIHFREKEQGAKQELTKDSRVGSNQRTPRQNIRTPNKFKEFDVDLVGVNPRVNNNNDGYVTNARSYSKPRDSIMTRKRIASTTLQNQGKEKSGQDDSLNDGKDIYDDDLPNLNSPRRRGVSESSKASTTKPEDLTCHICNKSFISKFGLMTHAITHPEPHDPNKCRLCDQSFSTVKGLSVHNVIVHKIAAYKEEASMKQNQKEEGFNDIALIDFSAEKFAVVAESACTKIKRSQSERDTQHIFVCKKCDKAFPMLEALNLHMEHVHWKQPEKAEARNEKENFLAMFGLTRFEVKSPEKEPVQIYDGVDDDYIYASQSSAIRDIPPWMQEIPDLLNDNYLKENEVSFTKPKLRFIPRRCPSFPKDSETASFDHNNDSLSYASVRTREIAKRRSRNYVGEEALIKTLDIARANDAEKNGERNVFWCRICNYSSHEKSALVRHLLTHSGIRPYFCKICDYAFTTKANCERHVRKRHNRLDRKELNEAVRCDWEMLKKAPRDDIYMISGSNSSCPVCNKSFSCNNELKQHLKLHEERQFVCQLCNVRCTTRNNCVRHILHKHPGIPHQEANTIITFLGTGRKKDSLQKVRDEPREKDKIDISRGCLGGRKTNKRLPPPLIKARPNRRSDGNRSEEPSRKKRRLSGQDAIEMTSRHAMMPDEEDSNIPMSLPESEALKDHSNFANIQKTIKCLPLIPLLKIKAYNEAAARSYSDMVSLYQNLNFLNSHALDDSIMPMVASPDKQLSEDLVTGQETAFICRSCSNTFQTEDELNQHILSCNENETDLDNTMPDEFEQMFNPDQHYDSSNWRNDDLFVNTDIQDANNDWMASNNTNEETALTPDWANTNSFSESPMKRIDSSSGRDEIGDMPRGNDSMLHDKSYENNQSVEQWMNSSSAAADSPYSMKSGEANSNLQDYEGEFGGEGPRVFASHGKESSYIEDSLLLSMYRDGEKEFENENLNIASSRYSSSFPTMVNMESPTMTRIKYQNRGPYNSSSEIEADKAPVPKGRYSVRKCPQCDKTFPWASSLRRHIMTHTGLKLYMCRVCKMRFTTRSNLIRHVYRRHGMAKQHPDFSSCLAKLHPSDTLLKEVEADVRRRVDGTKKKLPEAIEMPPVSDHNDAASNQDEDEFQGELQVVKRKKTITSDFQSMLEEDPETMLVDLDYSPREELLQRMENKRMKSQLAASKKASDSPNNSSAQLENLDDDIDDVLKQDNDTPVDMTTRVTTEDQSYAEELQKVENELQSEPHYHRGKNLRRRSENKSLPSPKNSPTKPKAKEVRKEQIGPLETTTPKTKGRNKQSTQFVCGLCKKIFKTVPDLISHLDMHNVPHSWHCPVCGVPFTNKYNCQRHLTRRHGRADIEPLYVEDSKHGPRTARGQPKRQKDD